MISIVTSAYNASSTIGKTIESVQSQTFQDWEMVIVNDFSSDNTLSIIESYAKEDRRIRIFNHERNKGAGCARKTGISHVRGEWMTFLDSDDYLKEDCLDVLNNYSERFDVDIISQGYIRTDEQGGILETRVPDNCIYVDGAKFKDNEQKTKYFLNPMLIRSNLWSLAVYSERRFIEDLQTLVQLLYYARSIMTIKYAGYYYVQKASSLINSSSNIKYLIHKALCSKDTMEFFRDKNERLANPKMFLYDYKRVIESLSGQDKENFSMELKELEDEYISLTNG